MAHIDSSRKEMVEDAVLHVAAVEAIVELIEIALEVFAADAMESHGHRI